MPLVARCWSSFLKTITFSIIHRFLSLKVLLWYICFSKSTAYNTFQFETLFWIWWMLLDTIILWQDVGPCCEQTRAAFEVGLSLDQGQGVYSGWSDVVVSSQLCLCHTCIIDVMVNTRSQFVEHGTKRLNMTHCRWLCVITVYNDKGYIINIYLAPLNFLRLEQNCTRAIMCISNTGCYSYYLSPTLDIAMP